MTLTSYIGLSNSPFFMRGVPILLLLCVAHAQTMAQPGLKGEYYTGTNFEHKVFTRIDPTISFNWLGGIPGPGMPESYYSIRWTGKLLAPTTGEYKFSAKVDDGIRVWVGNKKVIDSWQLNDSQGFSGSIILEAGNYYDLRVDYFNDMLEGEIQLFWQRPDDKSFNPFGTAGKPITAQYFVQKTPVTAAPKIRPNPAVKPSAIVSTPPKTTPQKKATTPKPAPTRKPPSKRSVFDSLSAPVVPVPAIATRPPTNSTPDTSFNLRQRNIQFEQSSYVLLPESATELDELIRVLKKHPDWRISVAGYTDNVGDPRLNLALSEFRARVVANYLRQRGITDERMTTIGYGDTYPYSDNKTEEGRSQNRRVVIKRQ